LCLTTTRWSWGHKTRKLFCRLLEEERYELFRLFPESLILNPEFPQGENLLLLQHSALGVPKSWHLCLVSSPSTIDKQKVITTTTSLSVKSLAWSTFWGCRFGIQNFPPMMRWMVGRQIHLNIQGGFEPANQLSNCEGLKGRTSTTRQTHRTKRTWLLGRC
jgi:hypothetical protein